MLQDEDGPEYEKHLPGKYRRRRQDTFKVADFASLTNRTEDIIALACQ